MGHVARYGPWRMVCCLRTGPTAPMARSAPVRSTDHDKAGTRAAMGTNTREAVAHQRRRRPLISARSRCRYPAGSCTAGGAISRSPNENGANVGPWRRSGCAARLGRRQAAADRPGPGVPGRAPALAPAGPVATVACALHGATPLRPRPQPIADPCRLDHLDIRRQDRLGRHRPRIQSRRLHGWDYRHPQPWWRSNAGSLEWLRRPWPGQDSSPPSTSCKGWGG
jgi:hypothetical protein